LKTPNGILMCIINSFDTIKRIDIQNFNDLSKDPETRTSFGNNWRHQIESWCALSIVLIQLKELIFQNFNDLSIRIQKQEHHLVIIEDTKWNLDVHYQ
jgi:hypothetical protein